MTRTLTTQTWWLLALCGALDALHAVMNLLMLNPAVGSLGFRGLALTDSVRIMSMLALLAGVCAIAAGFSMRSSAPGSGRDGSWLLAVHGLALAGFGSIGLSPLVRSPLGFRPISLLFVVMALSLGAVAFRKSPPLTAAGVASMGFALSFVAVGFDWVKLEPSAFWIWMSSYFAFCAAFMLWIAMRVRTQGLSQVRRREEAQRAASGVSFSLRRHFSSAASVTMSRKAQ